MKVRSIGFKNFRNLLPGEFHPCEGVNIIFGENAQGKTNLLEALWLFTGGRSFRGSHDSELVALQEKIASLSLDFNAQERNQQATIRIEGGKRLASLNGVQKGPASGLIGSFCSVLFSPEHLSLIKEGPSGRRRFLDAAICQIKPSYIKMLGLYAKTLAQRNALLKDIPYHAELLDTLEIWDQKISRCGGAIALARLEYIKRLSPHASAVYDGLSGKKEAMSIRYSTGLWPDDTESAVQQNYENLMLQKLREQRRADMQAGHTSFGPHRDDLEIYVNGLSARAYASQGQQRSCVLALKLAEAFVLHENIEEPPIVLLDDVMSELDTGRQDYILNHLGSWQVFITCCEPMQKFRVESGGLFEMKAGVLTSRPI